MADDSLLVLVELDRPIYLRVSSAGKSHRRSELIHSICSLITNN